MGFKRLVAKSKEELEDIISDSYDWFVNSEDYTLKDSKEKRKFVDPTTKGIVEREIDVIKLIDQVNGKHTIIKFIPMLNDNEMKLELGGEGESTIIGKIKNQLRGRGSLKNYSKNKKVAIDKSKMVNEIYYKLLKK